MLIAENYIIKDAPLPRSQDFEGLRKEAIGLLEKLGTTYWTDYNLHDPGITLLEVLCYAITELGYRTAYDMRDLLTTLDTNGVAINNGNFHTARQILTNFPVTFNDLRQVLIDIKGVRMAWIRKNNEAKYQYNRLLETLKDFTARSETCFVLNGLYDVHIEFDETVQKGKRLPLATGIINPLKNPLDFIEVRNGTNIRGLVFDVLYEDIILEKITVFPKTVGSLSLHLTNGAGVNLVETFTIDKQEQIDNGFVATLNWTITKGNDYVMDARTSKELIDPTQPLALLKTAPQNADFSKYEIPKVLKIKQGKYGATVVQDYFFFYNWQINFKKANFELSPIIQALFPLTSEDVLAEVRQTLHMYRNLGEDFVRVCEMKQEEIAICADIELEPYAVIEAVQAEMFYQISNHIAPPVKFYTLAEMQAKGKTAETIFEGPMLKHGFIDADEFRKITRLCFIRASDLIQIIMDIEGVKAVKGIEMVSYLDGTPTKHTPTATQNGWVLPLSTDAFRAPIFSDTKSKVFFYKNNLPYLANKTKAKYLLLEKKAQDIHAKLSIKPADLDCPVPVGDYKNLGDYATIQNDLPANYLVGRLRVPESATLLRKAQARQLKAYLLVFDQILSNTLSQLANVQQLFSWNPSTSVQSYFTTPLSKEGISNLRELYVNFTNLNADLQTIIETPALAAERRNGFLDHLLARFGENLTEYTRLMQTLFETPDQNPRIVKDKQRLLEHYPEASAQRAKGFDYRYPALPEKWEVINPLIHKELYEKQEYEKNNLTGYQKRVYRLLGFEQVERRELAGHRFAIESTTPPTDCGNTEGWFFGLTTIPATSPATYLFKSITCCNRQDIEGLLDEALEIGSDEKNYQLHSGNRLLLQPCTGEIEDRKIGTLADNTAETLQKVIDYFKTYANTEGYHVIEHILLRKRTIDDEFMPIQLHKDTEPCDCPEVTDPYSFRISVYLPSWSRRFKKIRFRQYVEKVLREECPAHIFPKICWISHDQMKYLEERLIVGGKYLEEPLEGWLQLLKDLPIGGCCINIEDKAEKETCQQEQRTGIIPLPKTEAKDAKYVKALKALIEFMHETDNVFPTARLHDCEETDGDNPEISLDNTNLGTL